MKTTKKIFAALLAVLMLTMMIPFSASAEDGYKLTLKGKEGYSVQLYKIASLDTETGKYSDFVSDKIKTDITDASINSAALLADCDETEDSVFTGKNAYFGSPYTFDAENLTFAITVPAGVYYAKITGTPRGVNVKETTNSVFSLPYYTNGNWVNEIGVDVASKISDDTPTVVKKIVSDGTETEAVSEFIGKTVDFKLTGSVVGTSTQKVKEYVFTDTMSTGLKFDAISSVTLTASGKDDKILGSGDYTYAKGTADNDFTITLNPETVLAQNDFYGYSNVVVRYSAKLDSGAVIGGEGNANKIDLTYTNSYNVQSTIPGNEVKVYTYEIGVKKVDGNHTSTTLDDAVFTLYTDSACTAVATNGAEQKTKDGGKAKFTGLVPGTYYLKETAAPAGYNINSSTYIVNIGDNGEVTCDASDVTVSGSEITVKDYPLVVPQTGGMGTMIFTICGIALIACAGALLAVVMKKKKAAE